MRKYASMCADGLIRLLAEEPEKSALLGSSRQLIDPKKLTKKEKIFLFILMSTGAYVGWSQLQAKYGEDFVNNYVYNCGIPEIRDDQLCALFNKELFGFLGMYMGMMIPPELYLAGRAAYNNHHIFINPSDDGGSVVKVKVEKPYVKKHPLVSALITLAEGVFNIPKYVLMGMPPTIYRMFTFLSDILEVEDNKNQDLIIMVSLFLVMTVLGLRELRKDNDILQTRMVTDKIFLVEENVNMQI